MQSAAIGAACARRRRVELAMAAFSVAIIAVGCSNGADNSSSHGGGNQSAPSGGGSNQSAPSNGSNQAAGKGGSVNGHPLPTIVVDGKDALADVSVTMVMASCVKPGTPIPGSDSSVSATSHGMVKWTGGTGSNLVTVSMDHVENSSGAVPYVAVSFPDGRSYSSIDAAERPTVSDLDGDNWFSLSGQVVDDSKNVHQLEAKVQCDNYQVMPGMP
jgi:hypothetical protein